MAKGLAFEHLVRLIQETLKDHAATQVLHNQALKTRTGRPRQLDVLIETMVNGFFMRIAIECKDHRRKVEAKEIEAFRSKCDTIGNIHKKVFVSKMGFQEGAIESAAEFGIDLHTLEEISGDYIVGWINTQEIYLVKFQKKYNAIDLTFDCDEIDLPSTSMYWSETVYYDDGQQATLHEFVDWLTREKQFEQVIRNFMMFKLPDLQAKGQVDEEQSLTFTKQLPKYAYLQHGDKNLYIRKIQVEIGIFIRPEKYQPEVRVLKSQGEEGLKAGVITFNEYDKDGSKLQMVLNPESGKFRTYITDADGSTLQELKTLAKYDPKTQRYERPDEQD